MKIDAYTKVILTLIATSLIVLVIRSFQSPPSVLAQQREPQHVIIDGLSANGGFISIGVDGLPVHEASIRSLLGQPVVIKGVDLIGQRQLGIPVYLADPVSGLPIAKPK